jgi:trimeric autotransporter adhesin
VMLGTGTLRLTTSGAITQTAGSIAANTAGLSAGTGITFSQPVNDVTTLAAQTATGNISLTDTNGFTMGSVAATADGFHPAISGLTAPGTIALQSGGAVTQTQRILASTLNLQGNGPYSLTNGSNDVGTLAVNTLGSLQYTDVNALILGASTVGGSADITTNGAITQSGAVTVTGVTTLSAGAGNDITLDNAGNNFSSIGVASGNNVALTDVDALTLNASTVSGNFSANAADLTVGGTVVSTGGNLALTATNQVVQSANLTVYGANTATVTAGGPIAMAGTATTSSGAGTISYSAGTDVTLGSLITGGSVNVAANSGSVLSAAGSGTNVTAGANSTLEAFNGVVGTQAAPMTVNVNPGTLSIRATTAVAGISAVLTGTVLPGNALTILNAPPGLTCWNGCSTTTVMNLSSFAGTVPLMNMDSVIPLYWSSAQNQSMSSLVSQYVPTSVLQAKQVDISQPDGVAAEIRVTEEQIASVPWSPVTDVQRQAQAVSNEPGSGKSLRASISPVVVAASGQESPPTTSVWPGNIYFDVDQHVLPRDAQTELARRAASFLSQGAKLLVIEGHADERGTAAYNFVLGEKRALSVKHYLEELGIPGSSVETISHGEIRPLCREHNEACWSKNRRAHLEIR